MSENTNIKETANIGVTKHLIYGVQGQRAMHDRDLAEVYDVETRVSNQAVERNAERAPEYFLFQQNKEEWKPLKNVIADADVAEMYGVETRRVNEAVRNNPDKSPSDYMFELATNEFRTLRSKISTTKASSKSRSTTKVFTEKGLYMLVYILNSERATDATFAFIEAFAKAEWPKRERVELHKDTNKAAPEKKMHLFGEILTDIVMPDLETTETESLLEVGIKKLLK